MQFPGGKGRLYPQLINLIPPHRVFVELFAGGAAVLRHKRPAVLSIAVERDFESLIRLSASKLPSTTLVCADAKNFLRNTPLTGDELIYCDPPYLPTTRHRRRVYRYDFTEADHQELLELLLTVPSRVLLSGYLSPLYTTRLSEWNFRQFPARTHRGWRTECVWFNYPPPQVLHDGRYLGANFRERHTIRLRLQRHRERISELSSQEQGELFRWLRNLLDQKAALKR